MYDLLSTEKLCKKCAQRSDIAATTVADGDQDRGVVGLLDGLLEGHWRASERIIAHSFVNVSICLRMV